MTGTVSPYCHGTRCPLRTECLRYKEIINVKRESHFVTTPYDHYKKRCGFFIGDVAEQILKELRDKEKGEDD
jgi:hypothetical protein